MLDLLGKLAADRVGDVDLAALQSREAGRLLGDVLHDQPLDRGGLAPITLERFED
jgi:hypothetical protein